GARAAQEARPLEAPRETRDRRRVKHRARPRPTPGLSVGPVREKTSRGQPMPRRACPQLRILWAVMLSFFAGWVIACGGAGTGPGASSEKSPAEGAASTPAKPSTAERWATHLDAARAKRKADLEAELKSAENAVAEAAKKEQRAKGFAVSK